HNDTTAGTASSFLINLTAQVINPVSVDVELVIDRSGSMSEASGSRIKIDTALDAARLFVELSRPDVEDRIGLVRFNNSPEVIPSYGIQFIIAANHASIKNQLNAGNYTPAGATSIAGGVIVAENNIGANARATPPPALNKIILVLTDGKDNSPYTNPADGQTYSLLGGFNWFPPSVTLPLPVPTDIKIYSIGIGDNIDIGRLAQLAASTGGAFLQAKTFSGNDYFNLEKQFTQVYMEAVNYAPISDPVFTILAGETHYFEFEVLAGDKSAMVVVYDREGIRLPFWIISPLGEIVDLLSVPAGFQIRPGTSPTARFIEINMPQHEPERYAGTWKIEIKHEGRACISGREEANKVIAGNLYGSGFQPTHCKPFDQPIMYGIAIGVGSNFNMISYVTPSIVKTGEPILLTALVSEFGLPVKGCTINIEARRPDGNVSHHILYDDGRHQDDDSDDGTYAFSYSLTSQEGIYTFKFNSTGKSRDGKTISRELVRSKYVEGRIPLVEPVPGFSDSKDECCSATSKWVRIGIVLLFIILIFVFLIWKSLRG
ncbi:MAG: vWA domain-containing protein, partial [Ferruginibacter sp.]